jgi:hypothetical protein
MDLRTDLRHAFVFAREVCNHPRFGDRVRKRLLAIDVTSTLERLNRYYRMGVVRNGYHHRIDIFLLQQEAKVIIRFGGRKFLCRGAEEFVIDVAQGHDVFAGDAIQIVAATIGDADDADVQLLVG